LEFPDPGATVQAALGSDFLVLVVDLVVEVEAAFASFEVESLLAP
jgi:hypothetical protein